MIDEKDFFVSYTEKDEAWAIWINKTLKNAGFTTVLQACDGGMVMEADIALRSCRRFVAVLSKEYLDSSYCSQVWTVAYKKDTILQGKLSSNDGLVLPLFVPVKIEDVAQDGLLSTRNYVSLYKWGKTERGAQALLEAISEKPLNGNDRDTIGFVAFDEKRSIVRNLPHPRNPYFTGRSEILSEISGKLKMTGMVSLVQSDINLAGVGKTEIANEYAYINGDEYETIWWIDAGNHAAVLGSLKSFAERKEIIADNANEKDIIDSLKYWFNNNENWLFIYDNARKDDFRWLEPFFPQQTRKGNVLVTTRNNFFPKCKSLVFISPFSEAEAVSFLEKRAGKTGSGYSKETAAMLSAQLRHLPRALEQAAAYIEKMPGVTYQDCVSLIEEYGIEALA